MCSCSYHAVMSSTAAKDTELATARITGAVYLISGMRWSFYGRGDVDMMVSFVAICGFLAVCMVAIGWIFRTGYKLKS